jgi:hypothetical protein
MHREKSKILSEVDREDVTKVIAEYILSTNSGDKIENVTALLPLWKKYGLYERCVGIRSDIVDTTIGIKRLERKIAEMPMPTYIPCSRDFMEGLIIAGGAYVSGKNVMYPSVEFVGVTRRKQVVDFLRSCRVEFAKFTGKWAKYIVRTRGIPFLLVKKENNIEQLFAGMLAGGELISIDGTLYISLKPACKKTLDALGIIYDRKQNKKRYPTEKLLVSIFYLALYMHMMPPLLFDYWMKQLPIKIGKKAKNAVFVANMHWLYMYKRRKISMDDALPYLSNVSKQRHLGIYDKDVRQMMVDKHMDFVDKRILNQCRRWMRARMMEDNNLIEIKEDEQ